MRSPVREYLIGIVIAAVVAVAACRVEGADIGSPVPKDEMTLVREQNEELLKQVAEIRATLTKLTTPPASPALVVESPRPKAQAPTSPPSVPYHTTPATTVRTGSSGPMAKVKSALGCSTSSISSTAAIQYMGDQRSRTYLPQVQGSLVAPRRR